MKRYIFLLFSILTITLSCHHAQAGSAEIACTDGSCTFTNYGDAQNYLDTYYSDCPTTANPYDTTSPKGPTVDYNVFLGANTPDNPYYVENCGMGVVLLQSSVDGISGLPPNLLTDGKRLGFYAIDCLQCAYGDTPPERDESVKINCGREVYPGVGTKCPPPPCDGPDGSNYCGIDNYKHLCPLPKEPIWTFTLGANGFYHHQPGVGQDDRETYIQAEATDWYDNELLNEQQCNLVPANTLYDPSQALFENNIGYGYFKDYDATEGCYYIK